MAWIQVDETLRDHRKTCALADALDIDDYAAVGLMVCLWMWALTNAEDGDLDVFPPRVIARACCWPGSAVDLVKALKAAGFVDEDGRIHDWAQYAGRLMDRRARNRERMRAVRSTCGAQDETNDAELPAPAPAPCEDVRATCAADVETVRYTCDAQDDFVRSTCSAQDAHKADTCAARAGATVQYQNSRVPDEVYGGGGGDACAGAREGEETKDAPDAGLTAILDAHNAVFDAAQRAGFAQTAHDLDKATTLMADYTPEWVLAAVGIAADGTANQRSWRYVEGVLKRWKQRGGMDVSPRPAQDTARPVARSGTLEPIKRVNAHQYTQRQYTAEEMDRLFDDLTMEDYGKNAGAGGRGADHNHELGAMGAR